MKLNNSHRLTYLNVTEALLADISSANLQWFPPSAARKTFRKVCKRVDAEGLGFLTKSLPRFGKALDRALSGSLRLSVPGFKTLPGSSIPKFLGELTSRVFSNDGWIKPDPCIQSVNSLRLILSLWYKLELTYEKEQEEHVLRSFTATEDDLPAPYPQHAWRSACVDEEDSDRTESNHRTAGPAYSGIPGERGCTYSVLTRPPYVHRPSGLIHDGGAYGGTRCCARHHTHYVLNPLQFGGFCGVCGEHGVNVQLGRQPGYLLELADSCSTRCRRQRVSTFAAHVSELANKHSGHQCKGYEGAGETCHADHQDRYAREVSRTRRIQGVHGSGTFGLSVAVDGYIPGLSFNLEHRDLIRGTRRVLRRLLQRWDHLDIVPKHGPGAVSGRETQAEKRILRRFIPQLDAVYPYDQYMYWSPSHLCDELRTFLSLERVDEPTARIVLVPKDSRGPRVISCENAENMRIQQGVMRSLVSYVEANPLTKGCVSFTDQTVNGRLAAEGSKPYGPATLDLKDASDRVSVRLVQLVWPEHLTEMLLAVRSTHTVLPSGKRLKLKKHAPMGSSLCFPVMACTIWAVATACLLKKYNLDDPLKVTGRIFVYGDDVIAPETDATDVMAALEAVGLKINRDKSYTTGLFKESCGEDWFAGHRVNGIKIRTRWSSRRTAEHYTSWIDYSNQFYERGCKNAAMVIAEALERQYGSIPRYPGVSPKGLRFPALVHELGQGLEWKSPRRKWDKSTQTWLYHVLAVEPFKYKAPYVGWCDLLDLATVGRKPDPWQSPRLESLETKYLKLVVGVDGLVATGSSVKDVSGPRKDNMWNPMRPFAVHKRSKLRRVWRGDNGV